MYKELVHTYDFNSLRDRRSVDSFEVIVLKRTTTWFVSVEVNDEAPLYFKKREFVSALRSGIIGGVLTIHTPVTVFSRMQNFEWMKRTIPLIVFAQYHQPLRQAISDHLVHVYGEELARWHKRFLTFAYSGF